MTRRSCGTYQNGSAVSVKISVTPNNAESQLIAYKLLKINLDFKIRCRLFGLEGSSMYDKIVLQ